MLRVVYTAQELLTTFTEDIHGVLLQLSEVSRSFIIRAAELMIYDRWEARHFPEIKEFKQLVRDMVTPGKSLGHSDKK